MEKRLHEIQRVVNSYKGTTKVVITKPQELIDDFEWLIEKVKGLNEYNDALQETNILNGELVVKYEEALKEIAEETGTPYAEIASKALEGR